MTASEAGAFTGDIFLLLFALGLIVIMAGSLYRRFRHKHVKRWHPAIYYPLLVLGIFYTISLIANLFTH